ncbi:hypothetical protein ACLK19_02435 [Escherichia coli]
MRPQENYPQPLTAACFDRWDLPLSDMYSPYVFPSRKRSALRDARIELWPTPVAQQISSSISVPLHQQLMETSHRHLLHRKGTWLNINSFPYWGLVATTAWRPSVSAEFQLSAGRYHYQLVSCQK